MSTSIGNSKSKAMRQACLVCLRISKETRVAGTERVTEEMTRNAGRKVARGRVQIALDFVSYVSGFGFHSE